MLRIDLLEGQCKNKEQIKKLPDDFVRFTNIFLNQIISTAWYSDRVMIERTKK